MSQYIIYCRKSSESEDRQILSIESQTRELLKLAEKAGLNVVDIVCESKSAKQPGRPAFNSVVDRIKSGAVHGLICWKLDRLARNALDGGALIHLIGTRGLRIVTPSQTFCKEEDNLLLLYLELGVAQKYIDDLSKNVRRGLRTKAQNGWYPQPPPPGYTTENNIVGEKIVVKDRALFDPVKSLWHAILYDGMSVEAARVYVSQTWRLQPSRRRLLKSKMLARSTVYRILNNPFYTGRFEYPLGSGEFYSGRHEPMISKEEFESIQEILTRSGKHKKTKKKIFPYRGLITCGECQASITYEEKRQIICSVCSHKFSESGKSCCPVCGKAIREMRTPKRLHYTYCHCTKRKSTRCSQRGVSFDCLESQIATALERVNFSSAFIDWLEKNIESIENETASVTLRQRRSIERGLVSTEKALANLVSLFTSPENSNHVLLQSEEYRLQRRTLIREQQRLTISLKALPIPRNERFSSFKEAAEFGAKASTSFKEGTNDAKHVIIRRICSNLILKDKKLSIRARFVFQALHKYHRLFLSGKADVRT